MIARSSGPRLFSDPVGSANSAVRSGPDSSIENDWRGRGYQIIAGCDEAGRGPLAGPVVAACVIFPEAFSPAAHKALDRLNDSKKLTHKQRNSLFDAIHLHADAVCVSTISAESIDQTNILASSLKAMALAAISLPVQVNVLLVDGNQTPQALPSSITVETVVKGDARSLSIAAASIIAKVTRDRMMVQLDRIHPDFGFDSHAGYGSARHRRAIADLGGVQRVHRFTFKPLRKDVSALS